MAKHVVIAIPAYSSTCYLPTFRSLLNDITTLYRRGDVVSIIDECGSAYIDDTRGYIVADFLKTDGTELVSVDHDLVWEPGALVRMVDAPVDMCAAVYRKRRDDADEYPVRYIEDRNELWADPNTGLLEVAGVPFGLVKCSRAMLERMVEAYPEQKVIMPDGEEISALFECMRDRNLRLHEDFAFCERWRKIGGRVWVDPEVLTAHMGIKPFVGNFGSYLRGKANLSWDYCVGKIERGEGNHNIFLELMDAWGNGTFAGSAKFLAMITELARTAKGPIVEFGSGLSTIVMRIASKQPITSFEQDPEWAKKLVMKLTGDVELIVRDLDGDFYDTKKLPSKHFALAVCDGPYKYTAKSRAGVLPVLQRVLKPGSIFVIDDLQIPGTMEALKTWSKGKADFELFTGDTRTFAIGRMKGGKQDGAVDRMRFETAETAQYT